MKERNVIPFLLIGLYLAFNWYNPDKSIPKVDETIESVRDKGYIRVASYPALFSGYEGPYINSKTRLIVFLVGVVTFASIFGVFATPILIKVLNITSLSVAVIVFISSTLMHNSSIKKYCNFTQLSLTRKYSKEEKEEKEDKEDKKDIIKLDTFGSSIGYSCIYFIGLVLLCIAFYKTNSLNKYSVLFIVLYYIIGLVFQLGTSLFLRLFHNKQSWPSVFSYLDQLIINNNENHIGFKVIGLLRLILIISGCIFVGYSFSIKRDSFNPTNVFKMITLIYGMFTLYVTMWQTFVGDGCVIDRTMKEYETGSDRSGFDLNYFEDILICSSGNQLGIYFHIILMALIVFII